MCMCLAFRPPNRPKAIEFWVVSCIFVTQWIKTIRIYPNNNTYPSQPKFRAMNGAHLASPIRGDLGYPQWPQLGSQIHCPIGNQILGPLGKEDVCPNGWQICVQQFGQL